MARRLKKVESALVRIDALEKAVKSGGAQKAAPDDDIIRRLEALEVSVMGICQLQQDSSTDVITAKLGHLEQEMFRISRLEQELAKIPRLERELNKISRLEQELADMNAAVQNLSSQLQTALRQLKKTAALANKAVQGLKSTWGYDLQNNYECQNCGSQGYVVGLVKCSDCGEEEWWGWWPPEEEEEDYEEDYSPAGDIAEWEGNWR